MKKIRLSFPLVLLFALGAAGYIAFNFKGCWRDNTDLADVPSGPEAVIENYGDEIKKCAEAYRIPPEYLAALCMLESGGRKPVPVRFEKHIYTRLRLVQMGLRKSYEHVQSTDILTAGDDALQNLASSWGPFQLMGYKCLMFDIQVKDLRGDNSVFWAAKWIDTTYGRFIRKQDFKSAFHMHNAGSPFPANGKPRTFHPGYVDEGLRWMAYFKNRI